MRQSEFSAFVIWINAILTTCNGIHLISFQPQQKKQHNAIQYLKRERREKKTHSAYKKQKNIETVIFAND